MGADDRSVVNVGALIEAGNLFEALIMRTSERTVGKRECRDGHCTHVLPRQSLRFRTTCKAG